MEKTVIKFGTDGFRGIIAREFTFETVERIIKAISLYIKNLNETKKTIIVGYDPRFMAKDFAKFCAELLKKYGFRVIFSPKVVPTPIVAYCAKYYPDSIGAIMLTASHNPKEYQGIKFIPNYAGPATKEITDEILKYVDCETKEGENGEIIEENLEENFFKHLESTYISDLIQEVRIKVRKTDGAIITFNELSEGEQQLLMVLGLLKFTHAKESLFLLDEPDTHLNPAWKFDYLSLIKEIVDQSESSQVIISTHDPIVIGGLNKEAVTIFDRSVSGTTVKTPDVNPKGMGVAGLLTSDLFGLPTTLDTETQKALDRMRQLLYKTDRTADENEELVQLTRELENLGFTRTTRDPLYDKFIERLFSRAEFQNKPITDAERKEMVELTDEILAEIMEEEDQ